MVMYHWEIPKGLWYYYLMDGEDHYEEFVERYTQLSETDLEEWLQI